jgi:hypothetical protein
VPGTFGDNFGAVVAIGAWHFWRRWCRCPHWCLALLVTLGPLSPLVPGTFGDSLGDSFGNFGDASLVYHCLHFCLVYNFFLHFFIFFLTAIIFFVIVILKLIFAMKRRVNKVKWHRELSPRCKREQDTLSNMALEQIGRIF